MALCTTCNVSYPNNAFCPIHGTPLRAEPAQETLVRVSREDAPKPKSAVTEVAVSPFGSAATLLATPSPMPALSPVPPAAVTLPETTQGDPWLGQVIGNYRLQSLLGQGGMGAVYTAQHLVLPKQAAVKLLKREIALMADISLRFQQEAKAAANINHENVVQIFDYGIREDGTVYLIMELLQGQSLSAYLKAQGPLSATKTHEILRPICLGLAVAHQLGIVHRDLKPDNIFLSKQTTADGGSREVVKLLDFGIAKVNSTLSGTDGQITGTGMILGTPFYMSPEQALGSPIDTRSDIYSLGVILYELLTGTVPFRADTFGKIMMQHASEAPVPPRKKRPDLPISSSIESVVLRCLEKQPEDRPRDVKALLQLFEAALPSAESAVPLAQSKRPWAAIALAGTAAALLAYALWPTPTPLQPQTQPLQTVSATTQQAQTLAALPTTRTVMILSGSIVAEVFSADGSTSLGKTPYKHTLAANEQSSLLLRADGYEEQRIVIGAETSGDQQVVLEKLGKNPPKTPSKTNTSKNTNAPPTNTPIKPFEEPKQPETPPKTDPTVPTKPIKVEDGALADPFKKTGSK